MRKLFNKKKEDVEAQKAETSALKIDESLEEKSTDTDYTQMLGELTFEKI